MYLHVLSMGLHCETVLHCKITIKKSSKLARTLKISHKKASTLLIISEYRELILL